MILTIDLESRSRVGITGGAWKYADHPSTQVLCVAVKIDDQPTKLLWTGAVEHMMKHSDLSWHEFEKLMERADRVIAHNAEFECAMLIHRFNCYNPRWVENLYCTMGQTAMCGLPQSLEKACEALNLPFQKDKQGNLLMKKICSPDKEGKFCEQEDVLLRIGEYCKKDVDATWCLYNALPKIPEKELMIWLANLKINRRGVKVDRQMIEEILRKEEIYKACLKEEFKKLTGVDSPSCVQQTLNWLTGKGLELPNLTAPIVAEMLTQELTPEVRRCLELRKELSRTSVKKYDAMRDMLMKDDRLRGMFNYHGAATGRWAGRGVQPHNLPRGKHKDMNIAVELLRNPQYSIEDIETLYGRGEFYPLASSAIRSAFIAKNKFVCCDFSAIEARVLAWLAGQTSILDAYRKGKDLYIKAASDIYHLPEERITKDQRQIGKISTLACDYQGGKGAFKMMAQAYGVDVSEDEADTIVKAWRNANPCIVEWWAKLNAAAINAILNPGQVNLAGSVSFAMQDHFLTCLLPSGRKLFYPYARVGQKLAPWGEKVNTMYYMAINIGRWMEVDTYGGCLAENIAQGTARDLLADVILKYQDMVVLHVHDEAVLDCDDAGLLEELTKDMSTPPTWAKDLPLAAEGWEGMRYKK